jgi:FkbM family methyltransferase
METNSLRSLLAEIFKFLFKVPPIKKRFFGIHKRIISPLKLFKGVTKQIKYKNNIIFELHIDDWIQESLFFIGKYEETELQFIERSLNNGNVFIDIGANIGLYTLLASKLVGEEGKVFAFEPFSKNFHSLKKNVSLNRSKNILLENLAVAETNKQIEIFYNDQISNFGIASSYLTQNNMCEKIDAVSIDNYLNKHTVKELSFIKIDIEGGEYPALLGMKETLTNFSPILLVEINQEILSNTPYSERDIIDYLSGLGYNKFLLDDKGNLLTTSNKIKSNNYVFMKEVSIDKQYKTNM